MYELDYLKLCKDYIYIEEKEIICIEQKYYPFVTKLLNKKLFEVRNKMKLIVNEKQTLNAEIETTNESLSQLKTFIDKKKKGYIGNKEIIQEDSKEFTQSFMNNTKSNKMINLLSVCSQNKLEETENEYGNNIIIIDNGEESFDSGQITNSSKQEKTKNINITNNIQQLINLNMNINFNLNFQDNDNEKIICNTERKAKDIINLLIKNKKKKGLSSTGSLPCLESNSIKEDIVEISINDNAKNLKKKDKDSNSIFKLKDSKKILDKGYLITE